MYNARIIEKGIKHNKPDWTKYINQNNYCTRYFKNNERLSSLRIRNDVLKDYPGISLTALTYIPSKIKHYFKLCILLFKSLKIKISSFSFVLNKFPVKLLCLLKNCIFYLKCSQYLNTIYFWLYFIFILLYILFVKVKF